MDSTNTAIELHREIYRVTDLINRVMLENTINDVENAETSHKISPEIYELRKEKSRLKSLLYYKLTSTAINDSYLHQNNIHKY